MSKNVRRRGSRAGSRPGRLQISAANGPQLLSCNANAATGVPGLRDTRRAARRLRLATAGSIIALTLLLLAACRTAPPVINNPSTLALLPPNARGYFFVNVRENRDTLANFISELGGNPGAFRSALDHTNYVYGALAGGPGSLDATGRLYLVGIGNYPGFLFTMGLRRSKQWAPESVTVSGRSRDYFRQTGGTMEVALGTRGELLASNGDIATLFQRESEGMVMSPSIPSAVVEQFPAHAAVWFVRTSGSAGVPSVSGPVSVYVDMADRALEISSEVRTGSESDARSLTVALRLFVVAILGRVGVAPDEAMQSVKIKVSGTNVTVSGITIGVSQAAEVLSRILKGRTAGLGADAL